jgi:hypothetical protein
MNEPLAMKEASKLERSEERTIVASFMVGGDLGRPQDKSRKSQVRIFCVPAETRTEIP